MSACLLLELWPPRPHGGVVSVQLLGTSCVKALQFGTFYVRSCTKKPDTSEIIHLGASRTYHGFSRTHFAVLVPSHAPIRASHAPIICPRLQELFSLGRKTCSSALTSRFYLGLYCPRFLAFPDLAFPFSAPSAVAQPRFLGETIFLVLAERMVLDGVFFGRASNHSRKSKTRSFAVLSS